MNENNNEYDIKLKRSPLPYIGVGAFWFIWAFLFPLYLWYHFIIVAALSCGVYFVGNRVFPPKQIKVPRIPKLETSGVDDVDHQLKASYKLLGNIEESTKIVQTINSSLAAESHELVMSGYKILNYIAKYPDRIQLVRRFLTYYVPTLDKLLDSYIDFRRHDAARETVREIEEAVPAMKAVFIKQLNKLMEDRELDISTDIDVLEAKLAGDGIKNNIDNK